MILKQFCKSQAGSTILFFSKYFKIGGTVLPYFIWGWRQCLVDETLFINIVHSFIIKWIFPNSERGSMIPWKGLQFLYLSTLLIKNLCKSQEWGFYLPPCPDHYKAPIFLELYMKVMSIVLFVLLTYEHNSLIFDDWPRHVADEKGRI